jgi:hypothetical protein
MANGGLQHLPQGHDLIVNGASRWRLARLRRGNPVHPIFLDLARRNCGETHVVEKRQQVEAQPDLITLRPALAALALGDDLILFQELVGGLAEGLQVMSLKGIRTLR